MKFAALTVVGSSVSEDTVEINSGYVIDTEQRSDTHVSGYGSTVVYNGSGGGGTRISSRVSIHRDIYIETLDGEQHVRINFDYPVRKGQLLHFIWVYRGGSSSGQLLAIYNSSLNTTQYVESDKKLRPLFEEVIGRVVGQIETSIQSGDWQDKQALSAEMDAIRKEANERSEQLRPEVEARAKQAETKTRRTIWAVLGVIFGSMILASGVSQCNGGYRQPAEYAQQTNAVTNKAKKPQVTELREEAKIETINDSLKPAVGTWEGSLFCYRTDSQVETRIVTDMEGASVFLNDPSTGFNGSYKGRWQYNPKGGDFVITENGQYISFTAQAGEKNFETRPYHVAGRLKGDSINIAIGVCKGTVHRQ